MKYHNRLVAARIYEKIMSDSYPLDDVCLNSHDYLSLSSADRRFVDYILHQTFRYRRQVLEALSTFLQKPLDRRMFFAQCCLEVAATEMLFCDHPPYAVVDGFVHIIKMQSKTTHLSGLVNAVLKNIAREREDLKLKTATISAWPSWLMTRWQLDYGHDRAARISAAFTQKPTLDISVVSDNAVRPAHMISLPNGSLRSTAQAMQIDQWDGYEEGHWWIQNMAASMPVRLLGSLQGLTVLDLCAAPGGKTAQLACAGAKVTAVDNDKRRLERLNENIQRLKLQGVVSTVLSDVLDLKHEPVDLVVLDAPCSASGTLRHHPDLACIKDESDVLRCVDLQQLLLDKAIGFVKPGGRLLYMTCSMDHREGEQQIASFLDQKPDLKTAPFDRENISYLPPEAINDRGMLRLLPHYLEEVGGMDGFFAACVQK